MSFLNAEKGNTDLLTFFFKWMRRLYKPEMLLQGKVVTIKNRLWQILSVKSLHIGFQMNRNPNQYIHSLISLNVSLRLMLWLQVIILYFCIIAKLQEGESFLIWSGWGQTVGTGMDESDSENVVESFDFITNIFSIMF